MHLRIVFVATDNEIDNAMYQPKSKEHSPDHIIRFFREYDIIHGFIAHRISGRLVFGREISPEIIYIHKLIKNSL